MRISPRVRKLALVSVAVFGGVSGALVGDAPSHEDTGGPARVNDSVKLTEVTALTDQDDSFNGLSEYCIRVTIVHPDHIGESESVDCVDVNWDDTDKKSGKTWEELGSLPLIGPGGYAGSSWESVDHTNECVDSAPWTLRTRLTESNTFGLADILAAIGEALTQGNASGATGGKLFLYGEAAKIAAKILKELFSDLDNLGVVPLKWEAGEGDPGGTVPKGPDEARHFKAGGEKTVTRVSPDCTTYTLPTAPTTPPKGARVAAQEGSPADSAPAQLSQTAGCGSDARHILCKGVRRARRSWRKFDLAARRIARLGAETGQGRVDIRGMRRSLIKLVGGLSRYAAQTEAREVGRKRLGRRARATLKRARKLIRQGNKLQARARRQVSPRLLRQSVARYRSAHLRLLPLAHPTFNRRR